MVGAALFEIDFNNFDGRSSKRSSFTLSFSLAECAMIKSAGETQEPE